MRDDARAFGWRLSAPAFVLTIAILLLPLMFSFYISFHRWNLAASPNVLRWVGFDNYLSLLRDPGVWKALTFTLTYTAFSVLGELILGFALALLLDRVRIGRGVFVSLLVLPMMMAPIVTGLSWRLLLNPEYGPLNQMLGLQGTLWLGDVTLAKASVIAATIWQEAPFMMVLLLAGLRSLPREPYDAAMIDGANWLQSFLYITLPLMKPVIMVALLIRTIFELRAFDIVWILTSGGPAGATETISLRNFQMSFRHFSIGPGAALSWLTVLVTMAIAFWHIRSLGNARAREATA